MRVVFCFVTLLLVGAAVARSIRLTPPIPLRNARAPQTTDDVQSLEDVVNFLKGMLPSSLCPFPSLLSFPPSFFAWLSTVWRAFCGVFFKNVTLFLLPKVFNRLVPSAPQVWRLEWKSSLQRILQHAQRKSKTSRQTSRMPTSKPFLSPPPFKKTNSKKFTVRL